MEIDTKAIEYVMTRVTALAERVDKDVSSPIPSETNAFSAVMARLEQSGSDIALLARACSLIRRLRD